MTLKEVVHETLVYVKPGLIAVVPARCEIHQNAPTNPSRPSLHLIKDPPIGRSRGWSMVLHHRGTSVAWECDELNGHVVTVVVGAPTVDDWSTVAHQQVVTTDRQSITAHLIDARDCDLTNIITAEVADIAAAYALHDRRRTPLRRAVVANDALRLATALQRAVPAGSMPVVFNDLSAACRWLGIDRNEAITFVERLHAAIDEPTTN